jgi:oxalyl-CoA decarboxylase
MILISGSSGAGRRCNRATTKMDSIAVAKPVAKAAFRVLHAEDIGVGII